MKRIYLSHPFGGNEENRDASKAVAAMYRDLWKQEGRDNVIVNPLELLEGCDEVLPDGTVLNAAVELMKGCDVVIFCDGWENSEGCKREHYEADLLDMECVHIDAEIEAAAKRWYGKHRTIVKRAAA